MDPTMQLLAMRQAPTQQLAQLAIVKKSHEMDLALADMIAKVADSTPAPAGTGRVVDKRA